MAAMDSLKVFPQGLTPACPPRVYPPFTLQSKDTPPKSFLFDEHCVVFVTRDHGLHSIARQPNAILHQLLGIDQITLSYLS